MGGDRAPEEIVRGAVQALSSENEILLVGVPEAIEQELRACRATSSKGLKIIPAQEVVAMDESPASAVRRKKGSSMAVTLDLVKRGEADAAVSAGNSGAMMALAMMTLGRIQGIDRPAIATVLPVASGGRVVLLDAGANVDCSPENLLQFAQMGSEFARAVLGKPEPRIGVLSIGEEASKGNALTKESSALIHGAGMPLVGNIEGRQLYSGIADVVVCDGFVGNVTLKVAEGTAELMQTLLFSELKANPARLLLGAMMRPVFRALRNRTDYDQVGGAPLLGVNGVCIISHGRSNSRAVVSAIREAEEAVRNCLVGRIAAVVE